MWRYQAAQAHGGNGSECGGVQQSLQSNGCNNYQPPLQNQETVIGNCQDPNAWVCEWPDRSWKNCLDTQPGNQSLFNDTYCNGQQMWKYQAAQAHSGNGSECGGTWQNYKSAGCGN